MPERMEAREISLFADGWSTDARRLGPALILVVIAAVLSFAATPALAAEPPTVTKVEPRFGPASGGTSVTITGTKFTGVTAVDFGSTAARSFTVNSETSITAVSPAGTGTVDVTVTAAGGTSASEPFEDGFEYGPNVTYVVPERGPNAGGTSVEVNGTNFNEVEAVQFGESYASFTRNSETSITAVAPPFTEGPAAVLVTVTTRGGVSLPCRGADTLGPCYFRYGPVVTRVEPNSGPPAGGTSVTIFGKAFEARATDSPDEPPFIAVRFGSAEATSVEIHKSPFEIEPYITAVAPPGTGSVDVTVQTRGGTSPTSLGLQDRFTYGEAPTVVTEPATSVTGRSATLHGTVNPNGSEAECKFEYGPTTEYAQSVPCAPSHISGTSPVEVSAQVTGLTANTTYHFRISATNAVGTSKGADEKFTTLPPECPATPPKVTARWHYRAHGSPGKWGPTGEMKCGTTTTVGPKGTEPLKISPGERVEAGYDFTLPGNKRPFTVAFTDGKVVLKARCVSGAKPSEPTFTVSFPSQSYTATNAEWIPSGNQSSPLVYQGATAAPNLCGGGKLEVKESAFSAFMTIQ